MKRYLKITRVASLLTISFLLLTIPESCRKSDTSYTPATKPSPVDTQPVFKDNPLKLMAENEINNDVIFPAYLIHRLGKGMGSHSAGGVKQERLKGGFEVFDFITGALWDTYEYTRTEQNFSEIKQGLDTITEQVAQLSEELTDLGFELSIKISELENFITQGRMNYYTTLIDDLMDSTSNTGLLYYPKMARECKAGLHPPNYMETTIKPEAMVYARNVYYKEGVNYDVCDYVNQIHALVCPTVMAVDSGALMTYADELLQNVAFNTSTLSDTVKLMYAYKLLENYFLHFINYQFQASIIWMNSCNFFDTTGYEANLWYHGTFRNCILDETVEFLEATSYLAININDYRNLNRYSSDMQFADQGLTPDALNIHFLARAQFVANLIVQTFGIAVPVMCGSVIVPHYYQFNGTTTEPASPSITISVEGVQLNANAINAQMGGSGLPGRFPYTLWMENNSVLSSSYDNHWNFYHFGNFGVSDSGWQCSPQNILLIDNGSSQSPWYHITPVTGSVTPLYYNPKNPSETSTYYTSDCSMQFAYFAGIWTWGYMAISNSPVSKRLLTYPCFIYSYTCTPMYYPVWGVYTTPTYSYGSSSAFSYPNNNFSKMVFNYWMTQTSGKSTSIWDGFYRSAIAGAPVPPQNGGIEGWAWYQGNYTIASSSYPSFSLRMGHSLSANSFQGACSGQQWYLMNGDIASVDLSSPGSFQNVQKASLTAGAICVAGTTYAYSNTAMDAQQGFVHVHSRYQFVYQGTINIFQ